MSPTGSEFDIHMPHVVAFPNTWFTLTNATVAEWVIMAALIAVAFAINRALRGGRRSRLRILMEYLMSFLEDWYQPFLGDRRQTRRFLPLLTTLFLFILTSNYLGIVPTVGYPGSLFAPTARWGTTAALALIVMFICQYVAIRELGFAGWIKHLFHMFPMGIIEEIAHPFSLSLRLFGNVFGEETLLAVIVFLVPMFVPLPIMALSLLLGAIQAVVFTTLAATYIGNVLGTHESAGGPGAHDGKEEGENGSYARAA